MRDPLLALLSGVLLLLAVAAVLWPKRGLLARWQAAKHNSERVRIEDALKYIHKCEMHSRRPTLEGLAGALRISTDRAAQVLGEMQAAGLIEVASSDYALTARGREAALHIIRAHRLWERYLAERTGFSEQEWHEQAERLEHALQPEQVAALAQQLGNPTHDPHGDPIPDAEGNFVYHGGRPLPGLEPNTPARIVHIEDEPEAVYAQLVAEGLYPGMVVRVLEVTPTRLRFWANGDEHVLAPLLAANISVRTLPEPETDGAPAQNAPARPTLATLRPGEQAHIAAISPRCRGVERRRMMDLGFLPGALISAEMISPGGDPTAYRIRGALIALRREQAQLIDIAPSLEAAV